MLDEKLSKLFGKKSISNIVIFLSKHKGCDFSKKEIAERIGLSRLPVYKKIKTLEEFGIVKVTRKFGKTKLYELNFDNEATKCLVRTDNHGRDI